MLGDMEFYGRQTRGELRRSESLRVIKRANGRPETSLIYRYPAGGPGAIYGQIAEGTRSDPTPAVGRSFSSGSGGRAPTWRASGNKRVSGSGTKFSGRLCVCVCVCTCVCTHARVIAPEAAGEDGKGRGYVTSLATFATARERFLRFSVIRGKRTGNAISIERNSKLGHLDGVPSGEFAGRATSCITRKQEGEEEQERRRRNLLYVRDCACYLESLRCRSEP